MREEASFKNFIGGQIMWYRFCKEGHIFSYKPILTDEDKMYCNKCNEGVDIYEEISFDADSAKEARQMYDIYKQTTNNK